MVEFSGTRLLPILLAALLLTPATINASPIQLEGRSRTLPIDPKTHKPRPPPTPIMPKSSRLSLSKPNPPMTNPTHPNLHLEWEDKSSRVSDLTFALIELELMKTEKGPKVTLHRGWKGRPDMAQYHFDDDDSDTAESVGDGPSQVSSRRKSTSATAYEWGPKGLGTFIHEDPAAGYAATGKALGKPVVTTLTGEKSATRIKFRMDESLKFQSSDN